MSFAARTAVQDAPAWELAYASPAGMLGFPVVSLGGEPTGVFFKPDGLVAYVLDDGSGVIQQYRLFSAWDMSTMALEKTQNLGSSFDPYDLFFKSDGLTLYIADRGVVSGDIFQYTLTVAWDVSSISGSPSKSFDPSAQDAEPHGLFFKDDGTKMYVLGRQNYRIYEYDLGTAWDVSTATYVNQSSAVNVTGGDNQPYGLFFKPDGTTVFFAGRSNDRLIQASLSTPWDISTFSLTNYLAIDNRLEPSPSGLFFEPSGNFLFFTGQGYNSIYRLNNSSSWALNTGSAVRSPVPIGGLPYDTVLASIITPSGMAFKPDGYYLYLLDTTSDRIYKIEFATAWDTTSTATLINSSSIQSIDANPRGLFFKPDGLKYYFVGSSNDRVNEMSLSVAWDITSASFSTNFSVASQDTAPSGVFFKPDGSMMFVSGQATGGVYAYTLGTAWDISTASFSTSLNVSSISSFIEDLFFSDDGKRLFVIGDNQDVVAQINLSVAWTITSAATPLAAKATYLNLAPFSFTPTGLSFKTDGTSLFIVGSDRDRVFKFSM